ncbi:hypothetical protein [Photobacterium damselae]|uniref:hypothetical protein n=1 Tax=Photobacterium damselae TaxID=38293 RepID=UPI00406927F1
MNLFKGFFNPLDMYLSIAQMDDERAKIMAVRVIAATIIISVITSLLPLFAVNIPTEQYLFHTLINNCQIIGHVLLFPLVAMLLARFFVNRDLHNKISSSNYTNYYKTFLISVTSMTYVVVCILIFVFELSLLLSFIMSAAPHWAIVTVTNIVFCLVFVEFILMFIWYGYKPFSAIYQTSTPSVLKRILMLVVASIVATLPSAIASSYSNHALGMESISDNTLIRTTVKSIGVTGDVHQTKPMKITVSKVDTIDTTK